MKNSNLSGNGAKKGFSAFLNSTECNVLSQKAMNSIRGGDGGLGEPVIPPKKG
jgi:hypothetical protein